MSKLVHEKTVINNLTGEITHSETHSVSITRLDKEPPYVKMYINDIGVWQGLTKTETDILYRLSATVDYDGIIQVTTFTKKKICATLGIKSQSFANSVSRLVAKMILQRVPDAPLQVFTLNPYWFGRGDWKDILEQRKAFVVQITKAYGMELPANSVNGISFIEIQKHIKSTQDELEEKGQQRLVD